MFKILKNSLPVIWKVHYLILALQDFSPDNSASGFFCRMDWKIFLVAVVRFGMIIMRTLLRVSFILCGTVRYGCGYRYFFFFLLGCRFGCRFGSRFGSGLFHRKWLEEIVQNSGMGVASGSTSTGDGVGGTGRLFWVFFDLLFLLTSLNIPTRMTPAIKRNFKKSSILFHF